VAKFLSVSSDVLPYLGLYTSKISNIPTSFTSIYTPSSSYTSLPLFFSGFSTSLAQASMYCWAFPYMNES
jgi:hypothetical protein